MATELLPPAVQTFVVDATGWLAGIDEMIAKNAELVESIQGVTAAMAEMATAAADSAGSAAGAAAGAGAGAGAAATGEGGDAAAAAAAAQGELSEAEQAAAAAAELEAEMQADLAAHLVLLRDASVTAATAQAALGDAYTAVAVQGRALVEEQETMAPIIAANTEATDGAAASAGLFGSVSTKALLGYGAAVAITVKQAMDFNSEVTRLYTAAGETEGTIAGVSAKLIQLGDTYGYTGTQMAEAMYHPVSAGLSLKQSLDLVTQAANLANIHGANLEDTTYALSSVMKAFNVSLGDTTQTAALLNATVGQGDMRFQDFNQSVKNWAPTASAMGISLQSMGSALAYLTDRGNTAEVASTRLTQGLSMVTSGSKQANTFLGDLGLTTDNLALKNKSLQSTMEDAGLTTNKIAADLRKPDGIYVALTDMKDAFTKAGLSADQANEVMAKIFGGGRSDKAIMSLMQNLGGLSQKYTQIGTAAGKYGEESKKAAATPKQEWKDFEATIKNLGITFGEALLPSALAALHAISSALAPIINFAAQHQDIIGLLAAVVSGIMVVVAAMKAWAIIQGILDALMDANPLGILIVAIAGLVAGLIYAYTHFKAFRDVVNDVFTFLKTAVSDTINFVKEHWLLITTILFGPIALAVDLIIKYWSDIKDGFMNGVDAVINWLKQNWKVLLVIMSGPLAPLVATIIIFWKQIKEAFSAALSFIESIWKAIWPTLSSALNAYINETETVWSALWSVITTTFTTVWDTIKTIFTADLDIIKSILNAALKSLEGMWSIAWNLFKSVFTDGWDALRDLLNGNISGMLSEVGKIPGSILKALSSFGTLLVDTGRDLINGLLNGIKSALGGLMSTITNMANNISGTFSKILSIFSPSRVFMQHGEMIMKGLQLGLENAAPEVLTSMASIGKSLALSPTIQAAASPAALQSFARQSFPQGTGAGTSMTGTLGAGGQAAIGQQVNVNVNVQGSIRSDRDLARTIQQSVLRTNLRNPANQLSLPTGRSAT